MSVNWTLTDVGHILGAEVPGGNGTAGLRAARVVTDSRAAMKGDLFVALPGLRFDGHDFVAAAAQAGAAAAVVARPVSADIPQIVVGDTSEALRALARARRREFEGPVVAVTGSCGKTTTKDFITAVLSRTYRVRSSAGNYNNEYGVPLSVLALEDEDEVLVLELGVSAPGDMAVIAAVAIPTVAVITSIAPTHLEFFGDVAAVRREKGSLLKYVKEGGSAVLNADDPLVVSMIHELVNGLHWITYGFSEEARVQPLGYESLGLPGSRFQLPGGAAVEIRIPGAYNVSNALAAAAVGEILGVPESEVAAGLGAYLGRPLRGQVAQGPGDTVFFVDCYNSSPEAAKAALALVAGVPARRRIAILGDMLELGDSSEAAHRGVGRFAFEKGFDVIAALGPGGREILFGALNAGMPAERVLAFDTGDDLAGFIREKLKEGDVVLVKASRGVHLEEVLAAAGVLPAA